MMDVIELGEHFGYPKCCIAEFIAKQAIQPYKNFCGTGFIPCDRCNEKNPEEVLKHIAQNRKHPLPFPYHDIRELK